MRRCLASGETAEKETLVRFVLAPDGRVVPDLAERLPGRGAWVSAWREAVDQVVAKGLFARGFKTRALADADLGDTVERLLATRLPPNRIDYATTGLEVGRLLKCAAGCREAAGCPMGAAGASSWSSMWSSTPEAMDPAQAADCVEQCRAQCERELGREYTVK